MIQTARRIREIVKSLLLTSRLWDEGELEELYALCARLGIEVDIPKINAAFIGLEDADFADNELRRILRISHEWF